jgi:alpha-beta hydrolase superfamily lysophospholipase
MTRPACLTFDTPAGWCFGWYHAPTVPWHDLAVVLCPPLGFEAVSSYPTQVQLAGALADAGLPVLRFDYHGTGDSAGHGGDPDRVEAWLASIEAAVAQARAQSGAAHVALLGVRLGATLAIEAARRLGGVDSLVLWAPCPAGRTFVRELKAGGRTDADGSIHALGEHYSVQTLDALRALDATRGTARPASRVLVVGRDDLPIEGPLPSALRQLGAQVEYRVLPGFAAMVQEPRAGVLETETLNAFADWLLASPAAVPQVGPAPRPHDDLRWRATGEVRETALRSGPGDSLFGVLSEPAPGPAPDRGGETGIVLLNVGGNHHVGPHRVYVKMARTLAAAGHPVLRLDVGGIGDSPPSPGQPWSNLYDRDSVQDVRAAVDALAQRGCREILLMGICSGSYLAFQTALADERIGGVVLMNSRLLEWTPGQAGDSWQNSMQQYAKSTDYYRRAMFKPEVWQKFLRGHVNVGLIARRFLAVTAARLQRAFSFGGEREESLLSRMQRLCARGTSVLMLVSDADDGRDYVEFHFGAGGRRMRGHPNFRMVYVPDADHTFSRPGNQEHVLPQLLRYVDQRPPARVVAAPAVPRAPEPKPMAHARPL